MKTAEIERELQFHLPGSTHVHGVTYDGHDVWSAAHGSNSKRSIRKRKADEVRSVQREDKWVRVYSSECSSASGFVTRTGFPSRKARAFSMLWR